MRLSLVTGVVVAMAALGFRAEAQSATTIFVNFEGPTLGPGEVDSRTNTATIFDAPIDFDPYIEDRAEILLCVQRLFGPFGVRVTDHDPGETTPHFEAVLSPGSSVDSGLLESEVAGLPLSGCMGEVVSPLVLVFGAFFPDANPTSVCETAAQQVALAAGLDMEVKCGDVMSYESSCGAKRFLDEDSACGAFEDSPRDCLCAQTSPTQNSFRALRLKFGAPESTAPELTVTEPGQDAVFDAPPTLRATATDDYVLDRVEVVLDGAVVETNLASPYELLLDVSPGAHVVTVRALDVAGNETRLERDFTVEEPGSGGGGCEVGRGRPGFNHAAAAMVVMALAALFVKRRNGR